MTQTAWIMGVLGTWLALVPSYVQSFGQVEKIARATALLERTKNVLEGLHLKELERIERLMENCVPAVLENGQIIEAKNSATLDSKLRFRLVVIQPVERFIESPQLTGARLLSNTTHFDTKQRVLVWVDYPYSNEWLAAQFTELLLEAWVDLAGISPNASLDNLLEYSQDRYQVLFKVVEAASGGKFGDRLVSLTGKKAGDLNFWTLSTADEKSLDELFPKAGGDELGYRHVLYVVFINMAKHRQLPF